MPIVVRFFVAEVIMVYYKVGLFPNLEFAPRTEVPEVEYIFAFYNFFKT